MKPAGPTTVASESSYGLGARLVDWTQLTKLRLASLVSFTAFIGALLALGSGSSIARALEAAFWITCSAASGGVLNQVLERDLDKLMARTRNRPLPAGRVSVRNAILGGAALGALAVLGLALRFNLLSAFLALGALFTYVAVYTPLKRVSTLNTLVGALAGAAPAAIGYAALTNRVEGWAVALYALVFVWQFPHFMAIAWLYREDYARARMAMIPALPGCEAAAGRQALLYALVQVPVSLLPGVWGDAGVVYTAGATFLGIGYCAAAAGFAWKPTRSSARALLFASLAYLPLVLSLVLFDPVVRTGLRY